MQNLLMKVGRALQEMKHTEQTPSKQKPASKRVKASQVPPFTQDAAINEIVSRFGGTVEKKDFMKYLTKLFEDIDDGKAKIDLRRAIALYSGHGVNPQMLAAFLLLFAGIIPGTSGDSFSRNDAVNVINDKERILSSLRSFCTGSGARKMTQLMKLMVQAAEFIDSVEGRNQAPHLGTSKTCFAAIDVIKAYLSGKSSWEMVKGNAWEGENTIKAADQLSSTQKNIANVAQMTGIPADVVPMTRLGVVARVFLSTLPEAVKLAEESNHVILTKLTLMCAKYGSNWALSSMHSLDPSLNALKLKKDSKDKHEHAVDLNKSCNYFIDAVKRLLETAFDPPPKLMHDATQEEKRVQAALELLLFPYPRDCIAVETKRRTELADLLRNGRRDEFMRKIDVELDLKGPMKSLFESYYRNLGELSLTLAHAPNIDKDKSYAEFLWYFLHTMTFRKLSVDGTKRKATADEGAEKATKKRRIDSPVEMRIGTDHGDAGGVDMDEDRDGAKRKAIADEGAEKAAKKRKIDSPIEIRIGGDYIDAGRKGMDEGSGKGEGNGFLVMVKSYTPSTPTTYNYIHMLGTFLPIVFNLGQETTNTFFKFFQHLVTVKKISSVTMSQLIISFFGTLLSSNESEELRKLEKDQRQVFSLWNCLCMRKNQECGLLNMMSSVAMKTSVLVMVCWTVYAVMWTTNPVWFVLQQHWVIDFAVEKGLGYDKGPLKMASVMAARGLRNGVNATLSLKTDNSVPQDSQTHADIVRPSPSLEPPSNVAVNSTASWHQRFASLIPTSLKGKPSEEKKMVKPSIFKKKRHLFG